MAQQVKFHSVTSTEYAGVAEPGAGDLYFISDNGEIRKGDKHVTGTRVFTAVDSSTSGCSAVSDLIIKIGDTAITTEGAEQPKRGDMLVVSHFIIKKSIQKTNASGEPLYLDGEDQETTTETDKPVMIDVPDEDGPVEYSAYIYGANGGEYNVENWVACDGNIDASKVILTQNITMAGNYENIGNFSKDKAGKNSTFMDGGTGTAGKSVYELIKQMLSKTQEPTWKRNPPTASLGVTNPSSCEIGTTVSATFKATFNDAYASFDGGNNQMAGCSVATNGYKFDGDTTGQSSNSITKSWAAGIDTPPSAYVEIDYSASTNTIRNNLGDTADITPSSIASGTTASSGTKTASVTTYRNTFMLIFDHDNMISDPTDGTELPISTIKGSSSIKNATNPKSETGTQTDFQQILIFVPSTYTKSLSAETEKGLPYTATKLSGTRTIPGAGTDTGVAYSIWEIKTGSPVSSDNVQLKWA